MVKTSFIIMALVAATAYGKALNSDIESEYLDFISRNNKRVDRKSNYQRKLKNYKENDDFIKAVNKKSEGKNDKNALHLAHNITSDMDQEEFYENFLGAVPPTDPQIEADRSQNDW